MITRAYIYIILSILLPATAFAGSYKVSFDEQPITTVLSVVSDISGVAFVFAPGESDNQVISWRQSNLTQQEIIENCRIIMESLGYSVKMISTRNPYYLVDHSPQQLPKSLSASVGVYLLQNIKVEDIETAAEKLYPDRLIISGSDENNVVVFAGGYETVREFKKLLPKIDSPADDDILQIRLKYISVSDGLRALKELKIIEEDKFYPDYWGRSIIINGNSKVKVLARSILKAIDIEQEGFVDRMVHVNSIGADNVKNVVGEVYQDIEVRKISDTALLLSGEAAQVNKAELLCNKIDGTGLQVRIEAVIAYLTDRQFRELGVRLAASDGDSTAISINNTLNFEFNTSLEKIFQEFIGIEFSAEDTEGDGTIISSPTLVVMSGRSARLSVGRNIPYLSKANFDKNDGEAVGTSIERQDVGLVFNVKPVVSPGGDFITVELSNEISQITPESELGQTFVDAVFDKQEIQTDIRVADGETVFLGGLKIDEEGSSKSYIPILRDLPWIGEHLFTYDVTKKEKRNLVVSLRVKVVGG